MRFPALARKSSLETQLHVLMQRVKCDFKRFMDWHSIWSAHHWVGDGLLRVVFIILHQSPKVLMGNVQHNSQLVHLCICKHTCKHRHLSWFMILKQIVLPNQPLISVEYALTGTVGGGLFMGQVEISWDDMSQLLVLLQLNGIWLKACLQKFGSSNAFLISVLILRTWFVNFAIIFFPK